MCHSISEHGLPTAQMDAAKDYAAAHRVALPIAFQGDDIFYLHIVVTQPLQIAAQVMPEGHTRQTFALGASEVRPEDELQILNRPPPVLAQDASQHGREEIQAFFCALKISPTKAGEESLQCQPFKIEPAPARPSM